MENGIVLGNIGEHSPIPQAPANPMPLEPQEQQEPQEPQEPQAPNAYQSIIDQQTEQIAALIAANDALTKQVTNMVQAGAQFGQPQQSSAPQPMQQFNPAPLSDGDDWSLESLAKEIGRK